MGAPKGRWPVYRVTAPIQPAPKKSVVSSNVCFIERSIFEKGLEILKKACKRPIRMEDGHQCAARIRQDAREALELFNVLAGNVLKSDTDRLNLMIACNLRVQNTGAWAIVRDEAGRIVGEDETPRAALDNAIDFYAGR